jgi:hypothetical protein
VAALHYLEAGVDDLSPAKIADLLVVLGGPIGIYEVDRYPFLKQELATIETAVKKGVPTIGYLPWLSGPCRRVRRPRLSEPSKGARLGRDDANQGGQGVSRSASSRASEC